MKRTIDLYIEARYPRESIEELEWLESCCERLGELLESYRDFQTDGKLFSPKKIAEIAYLHMLEQANAAREEEENRSPCILNPKDLDVYGESLF